MKQLYVHWDHRNGIVYVLPYFQITIMYYKPFHTIRTEQSIFFA